MLRRLFVKGAVLYTVTTFLLAGALRIVGAIAALPAFGMAVMKPETTTQAAEARPLEPGKSIERELSKGQSHSYQILLDTGQYAHAIVYQKGIDLVLTVVGPDGNILIEVDSPTGTYGPEEVVFLARIPGRYHLKIQALGGQPATGRYEVKLDELRTATPQDEARLEGQREYFEAEGLRAEESSESLRRAIVKYGKAISLRRALGDRRQEAVALKAVGEAYSNLGERRTALGYYSEALPIFEAVGDPGDIASMFSYIGITHFWLGENQKALEYYRQELLIRRAVHDQSGEANVLSNIGRVYFSLGEVLRALDYYSEALPLRRVVGDSRGEAYTLTNIGMAYSLSGEYQKALGYLRQALPLRRAVGDRPGEAITLDALGDVQASLGDREKALDFFNQSLSLWRSIGNRAGEAETLNRIGGVYASFGEKQRALDFHNLALTIHRSIEDQSGEAHTLYNIARAERDRGNLLEARRQIETGLGIFDSLRLKMDRPELRVSYSASRYGSHEFYVDLLMALHRREPFEGFDAQALKASESARARSLLELLGEGGGRLREGVDRGLVEREASLRERLSAKLEGQVRMLSGKHNEERALASAKEIAELKAEYEEVSAQIRAASPHYVSLTEPRALSLAEIQKDVVDQDTMLLEYFQGQDRSFLWAVTAGSMTVHELPPRPELEGTVRRLYELLTQRSRTVKFERPEERRSRLAKADGDYLQAAAGLSEILLGPVAPQLERKRLLIVADGALQYLPFAALPVPGMGGAIPLAVEHEIVTLPSVSVLEVLRRELAGRAPPPKSLAVFADPVFEVDDERVRRSAAPVQDVIPKGSEPRNSRSEAALLRSADEFGLENGGRLKLARLPFTRREAKAILALVAEGMRMEALDFEASRRAATNPEVSNYRYVHFATHGFLNGVHPELSGIVLTLVGPRGEPQDGFLSALEVFNLKLTADLVVLSGCRTGLGKDMRGEGLIGLTRGFMYSGAARVIVSLWDVPDESTAELMTRLYKGILGRERLSPPAALRAAQLSIRKEKRWQHPYYWAGFVIQGEPR